MKVFRGNWLRLLLTLLIVCAWNELISSKLDSSKRFPSRRRGPPLDKYGDIEESRGFLDDSRGSRSDDPRDYYTEDSRISRRSESDDYRLDDDFEPTMSAPDDVVQQYTSKLSSAILVSICSGICSSVLVTLLMKMVINKVFKLVVLAVAIVCAGSCFSKNKANADITDFSNALGVFFLLLLKKSKPTSFVAQLTSQAKSAMLMSERNQFPRTDNPWQYVHDPRDPESVDFKMWNSLMGVVLMGTITGWSISSYVPLFPGWLGALGGASFFGYSGTLKDSRGDILRFVGFSLDQYASYLRGISNDVMLWDKTTVLSSRLFGIILRFEKRNRIVERLSFYLTKAVLLLTSFFKSVRSDINADTGDKRDRDRG